MMRRISSYEINFVNRLSENSRSTYTSTMRIRPNMDQFSPGSIATQHSLGNVHYTKSITESSNVLRNHRFYVTTKTSCHHNPGDHNNGREIKDAGKEEEDVNLSFAQLEGKCYC